MREMSPLSTGSDRRGGFTLFEVMVALAIFSIIAIACLRSYSMNLTVAARARETQTLVMLAHARAAELLTDPDAAEEGDGAWDPPYDAYRWSVRFSDAVRDETEEATFRVGRLTVTGPSGSFDLFVPIVKEEQREGS